MQLGALCCCSVGSPHPPPAPGPCKVWFQGLGKFALPGASGCLCLGLRQKSLFQWSSQASSGAGRALTVKKGLEAPSGGPAGSSECRPVAMIRSIVFIQLHSLFLLPVTPPLSQGDASTVGPRREPILRDTRGLSLPGESGVGRNSGWWVRQARQLNTRVLFNNQ